MNREELICHIVYQLIKKPDQTKACCGHYQ